MLREITFIAIFIRYRSFELLVSRIGGEEAPGQINDENCKIIVKLYSPGFFGGGLNGVGEFMLYAVPRIQLQLALIFLLTQSLHLLLRRFSLPRILSEILAGIILGRTVLGRLSGSMYATLFPGNGIFLAILSKIGFIFYMFMVGVKMDPGMVWKTGRKGISIGIAASIPPLIIGLLASVNSGKYLPLYRAPAISAVTQIQSVTPFPVIAGLLIDLKIMNSELGRLSLASTLISDLISTVSTVCVYAYKIQLETTGKSMGVQSFLQSVLIVVVAVYGTRPLFFKIIRRTQEGKPVKGVYIAFICWGVLVAAIIGENFAGLPYHFVPFVIGLAVPNGPPLGSTLVDKLDTFSSGLLAPLMITLCALRADLIVFYDFAFLRTICVVMLGAVVVKFIFVLVPALLNRVPIRDAVTLGIIMGAQGVVQGAYYDRVLKNQSIDRETFSLLIVWLAILATLSHLSVKCIYDYSVRYTGYQKRNILHTPYNSEFRVLACAHRPDDALASIKLLQASSPCIEAPIAAYALNLVELVGRATPLLINHKIGQKNSSGGSRSQQMMDVFQNFERQYSGLVSVQVFTSMSLTKFMHHDICSLAFDKLAALIILPFHRKWSQQGKIVFESNIQRSINREVLDMAPCSVGILIDRRKIRHEAKAEHGHSQYYVAVIFLGGQDDREALAYAKRMVRSTGVHLTVFRLVPSNELRENQWDNVLDTETLRDIKILSLHQNNINYREQRVRDGPETAFMINSMEDDAFDLVMVGRRHREDSSMLSGLSEWSDVPELGPLGDILASSDVNRPVSVLVVQQQIVKS